MKFNRIAVFDYILSKIEYYYVTSELALEWLQIEKIIIKILKVGLALYTGYIY